MYFIFTIPGGIQLRILVASLKLCFQVSCVVGFMNWNNSLNEPTTRVWRYNVAYLGDREAFFHHQVIRMDEEVSNLVRVPKTLIHWNWITQYNANQDQLKWIGLETPRYAFQVGCLHSLKKIPLRQFLCFVYHTNTATTNESFPLDRHNTYLH